MAFPLKHSCWDVECFQTEKKSQGRNRKTEPKLKQILPWIPGLNYRLWVLEKNLSLEDRGSCKKSSLFLLSDVGSQLSLKLMKMKAGCYSPRLFLTNDPRCKWVWSKGRVLLRINYREVLKVPLCSRGQAVIRAPGEVVKARLKWAIAMANAADCDPWHQLS